jgi:hypothetical protein
MDNSYYKDLALNSEWLCDVEFVVDPQSPGDVESPWGTTNVGYIASGEFKGPLLNGKVLPGGGDWPSLSVDGQNTYKLDVRAVWETHDGAKLFVQYYGFIAIDPQLPGAGESLSELDASDYYFRSAPTFRTGDERYGWLNKTLCVGIGRFTETGLGYRIYRIN